MHVTCSHPDATWCTSTSSNTIADNLKCNIYTTETSSDFHKFIIKSETQETIDTRVLIKVLSCDPKGDQVTFKWKISKNKPTEIYLLCLTKLANIFELCTLHSLQQRTMKDVFLWGGISGQFAQTTRRDAASGVTKTYCA